MVEARDPNSLRSVHLPTTFFATSRADLARDFYGPCLGASVQYDRAAGYFRSSFLVAATLPMRDFAIRGGRARLVCSPDLTSEDAIAIQRGYSLRSIADEAMVNELEGILERPHGESLATILSTLIAVGALDLKVAVKRDGTGIFHHKLGIFSDTAGDRISFVGSTNETWSGWNPEGNDESFEVFSSWESAGRVDRHAEFFDAVWSNREAGIEAFDLPDAVRQKLLTYANPDGTAGLTRFFVGAQVPSVSLYPHQEAALADWMRHGRKGVLEHATGSGKTITALAAIRGWLKEGKPALVIVPSELLLRQWRVESLRILADIQPPTLLAGAGHGRAKWEPALTAYTVPAEGPRLTIATLQTASTPRFLQRITDASELLVVVDEVHRAGSDQGRSIFSISAPARLGLSATPERAGDPGGTDVIMRYFGRTIEPTFSLRDAIAAGRLASYLYHVNWIELTDDEQTDWDVLTEAIRREYAKLDENQGGEPEHLKLLLIKRAAILKRAEEKPALAASLVHEHFQDGQAWLIYCDTQHQLGDVLARLRARGLPAFEYHSAMSGDRLATMSFFVAKGGILVAIRCLDEGVDIPRVSHALILASSRNTREFVQRRGRVLRRYPGKHLAEIFDVLVRPSRSSTADNEQRLTGPEIRRALVFAEDARNQAPRAALLAEMTRLGIDLIEGRNEGVEADD